MKIFCQSQPIDTNILPIFRKQNVPFSIVSVPLSDRFTAGPEKL